MAKLRRIAFRILWPEISEARDAVIYTLCALTIAILGIISWTWVKVEVLGHHFMTEIIWGIVPVAILGPFLFMAHSYALMRSHKTRRRLQGALRMLVRKEKELTAQNEDLELVRLRLSKTMRQDSLTGIANRRRFDEFFFETFNMGEPFALILIDLNDFKPINDTFGHDAGDHILRNIASRLMDLFVGVEGEVTRLGGDEFALVLTDKEALAASTSFIDAIRQRLNRPYKYGERELSISIALGIVQHHETFKNTTQMFVAADAALYSDKAAKKRKERAA